MRKLRSATTFMAIAAIVVAALGSSSTVAAAEPTGNPTALKTGANSQCAGWNGAASNVGSAVLGDNPLVVSVPFSMHALQGGNVTVIGNTTNGAVIFLGQYSTPVTPGP